MHLEGNRSFLCPYFLIYSYIRLCTQQHTNKQIKEFRRYSPMVGVQQAKEAVSL